MPHIIYDTSYTKSLLDSPPSAEPQTVQGIINILKLQPHIEGGYFVETDRERRVVPNPFKDLPLLSNATDTVDTSATRSASTSINYLVTPKSPVGYFHRNRGHTVHTLHKGRGIYVLLHVDQPRDAQGKVRVDSFMVGQDIVNGEDLQWVVPGGKFKASFLLPDSDDGQESKNGLLISETVIPGFEYSDHDFLTAEGFVEYLDEEQQEELKWLLKPAEQGRLEEVRKRK
jgi:predicted cupin superfamily sugar epimerase